VFTLWPNEATVFATQKEAITTALRMREVSKNFTIRGRSPKWEYAVKKVTVREYAEA
jgi:hypothetical protein